MTEVTPELIAATNGALLAGMLRSAAAIWRNHPSEVYRDAELAERVADFIEARATRPEPEGMETTAQEREAYAKAAETELVWPEAGFVGRLLRDFDRLSAEIASLKARVAEVEAEKAALDKLAAVQLATAEAEKAEAVREVREACAKIADDESAARRSDYHNRRATSLAETGSMCLGIGGESSARVIAAAIRARGGSDD